MNKYNCVQCGKVVYLQADAIYTPKGPLCDECSGEKRDKDGNLISVMNANRRSLLFELFLYGLLGIVLGSLIFLVLKEMGLMPYFWELLP